MKTLTKKQSDLANFISSYLEEHGKSPSYREIMREFGYSSTATVSEHIQALIKKGVLSKEKRIPRSLSFDPPKGYIEIPIIGVIEGGDPITFFANPSTVPCPAGLDPNELYAIQIQGKEYVEECICDGDIIFVEGKSFIENGKLAVILVDDQYTMIKIWEDEGDVVQLKSSQEGIDPLFLAPEAVIVQGEVVALERRYHS